MADYLIHPQKLCGKVCVPGSKSAAHRAIIAAALAGGSSRVTNCGTSQDIKVTAAGMVTLGAQIQSSGDGEYSICGISPQNISRSLHLDCGESGSTLRFLLPIALALGGDFTFHGQGRLGERPLDVFYPIFEACKIQWSKPEQGIIRVVGQLKAGNYQLSGSVSSQFVTGMLMALPLLNGDSELHIEGRLESAPYVDLTLQVMHDFGIVAAQLKTGAFSIKGGQTYAHRNFLVEGDWSQGAFWLVAAALGSELAVEGLRQDSRQGDRAIVQFLTEAGYFPRWENGILRIDGEGQCGIIADVTDCPDLVPPLAVLMAFLPGRSQIVGAARLRIKESDRLRAMTETINCLGGKVTELPEGLIIEGVSSMGGAMIDSFGDHRIVMAAAVAATKASNNLRISGAEAVNKSYPNFFEHMKTLGGAGRWVDIGEQE
jgi:3-phosphoshikimate 1-carboxyvinyltransferase